LRLIIVPDREDVEALEEPTNMKLKLKKASGTRKAAPAKAPSRPVAAIVRSTSVATRAVAVNTAAKVR